mmetsp:Transcript_3741/g.9440  ORF Transcript_3741/g.9440 Transcript_3741/m.9440 type:complete len:222 (+) Transcript_3741:1576-2241(+)
MFLSVFTSVPTDSLSSERFSSVMTALLILLMSSIAVAAAEVRSCIVPTMSRRFISSNMGPISSAKTVTCFSNGSLFFIISFAEFAASRMASIPPASISLASFVQIIMNSSMLTPCCPFTAPRWQTRAPSFAQSGSRGDALRSESCCLGVMSIIVSLISPSWLISKRERFGTTMPSSLISTTVSTSVSPALMPITEPTFTPRMRTGVPMVSPYATGKDIVNW